MLVPGLAAVGQQSTPTASRSASPQARFQLISAEVDAGVGMGGDVTHEVFLIDTQTGKVWRFQAGGVSKDKQGNMGEVPQLFFPVNIMNWNEASGKYFTSEEPSLTHK
jgi:hypothetical protein